MQKVHVTFAAFGSLHKVDFIFGSPCVYELPLCFLRRRDFLGPRVSDCADLFSQDKWKEEWLMERRFLWSIDRIRAKEDRCRCSETKMWKPLPRSPLPVRETIVAPRNDSRDKSSSDPWIARISRALNRCFLWLLLAAYAAAALWPQAGLWIRGVSFGELAIFGNRVTFSLPLILLALLLGNAGLAVRTEYLARLRRAPLLLGAALSADLCRTARAALCHGTTCARLHG
jgi:hypothetical protein